jgi:fucose permease
VAFLLYVSLEVTIGQWAFTSLTEEHGIGTFAASTWVALYWVALTAGRLWLGLVGHRASTHQLLTIAMVGTAAAAVVLWLGRQAAPVGLVAAGLALSVVFPLLMLRTPQRVGAERAASAVGWQTAAASIGAAAGPALAGVIFGRIGIDAYGAVVVAMALALAIVVLALEIAPGWARRNRTSSA